MITASSQIGAVCAAAPPHPVMDGLSFRRLGGHVRDMVLGLVLSLFATVIVYADEMPQSWVPEVLTLPDDAEVQMDRAIGSSIRMFSFSTAANVNDLFADWSDALESDGYNIRPQQADLEETAIEFSGQNIMNAKIATEAASGGDRVVITFDATLD
ncbi:hypothetical protein RA2_00839 [Roseovarius sp. A-2]|uniref:hypothetical protein n=1 Tax=Roseovarius sp. A-2 TaxID=1570360 RepID=UPI0009D4F660|nr:hypothetical protein [Roseovarius sp. A-2]GAW33795.1 hypothetical protein RA2_00839 [Roseovarius sp. A-2]